MPPREGAAAARRSLHRCVARAAPFRERAGPLGGNWAGWQLGWMATGLDGDGAVLEKQRGRKVATYYVGG